MRGRWGGRRGSFKFFIQKFYERINLSYIKPVTSKSDYMTETKTVQDLQYTDIGGIHTLESTHQFPKAAVPGTPTATIFTSINENMWVCPASGTYRVYALGGGGAGASGRGGLGGFFYADITFTQGETIYVGVGAGGLGSSAIGNSSGYFMRGGTGGTGSTSGAGGGGSYVASIDQSDPRPHTWTGTRSYFLIAGGGGGSADHGFTANVGGHGFGVGGGAYSAEYANTTGGGKNGFDGNNGVGGTKVSSTGTDGGSAWSALHLVGGAGGVQSNSGGGGGGGAGSGAGGAAGGSTSGNTTPGPGGHLSTSTTTGYGGSYTAEFIPRGGGGGGGHGSNCGGCGGGGGSLLYTGYNNSWGTTQGTQIPYWSGSSAVTASLNQYTAYNQFITDCSTYLGVSNMIATLSVNTSTAGLNANGQNGFVAIIPLQSTTYTIV
jgi:hypothetical protein